MRTLLLLRHAKSDWGVAGTDDFDRTLSKRGRSAAPRIGGWIREEGCVPGFVMCSTAARAQETWDLVAPLLEPPPEVEMRRDLYLAPEENLLAYVGEIPDRFETAMMIGHNPGLHQLALTLVGDGAAEPVSRLAEAYPTAALAIIRFSIDSWADVRPRAGHLDALIFPRTLS